MVGFVDDSTGSYNDFRPQTQVPLSQMFPRMEHDAQLWNNLLYCSGGKLELPKCSFHVLHFNFLPCGKPIPAIDQYDNKIHIQDAATGTKVPIPAKRSFERHKTLGHYKSPYTTSTFSEIKMLQDKADRLALALAISPISRYGAYLAYHTVFIPSIRYTLPQSFYPKATLDKAQRSSTSRILSKCGYNRNTARALIYAPLEYAGGGFLPWYLLQGEGQVQNFLKHWRTNTLISNTLRIAVSWAQWQSGHHKSIFQDVHAPLPYLECRWLRSLREFLASIDASIQIDTDYVAPPERENDEYIMKLARQCANFSHQDLAIINYCRLYLHITTISELFDADGKTIIQHLYDCQREPWFSSDTYVTLQQRPSLHQIKTKWQRLCRQIITASGNISASITLGPWIQPGNKLRRYRETYLTNTSPRRMYHWRQGSYWLYRRSEKYSNLYVPARASTWKPSADPSTPITAYQQVNGSVLIPTKLSPFKAITHIRPPTNFSQYVTTLSTWERRVLHGIDFKTLPFDIIHRMHNDPNSKTFLVSDGSQRGPDMTYGWVLGNDNGIIYAEHAGTGYGNASSHRAEAWGMLSGISLVHHLRIYTGCRQPETSLEVCLFSDNSGLIHRMKQRASYNCPYPNSTLQADWDLVEQIHSIAQLLRDYKITYSWVRGHQDDTSQNLTVEAQYNVRADELAGCNPVSRDGPFSTRWLLPAERCRLIIANRNIQSHFSHEIRHAYSTPPLMEYLTQRYKWTPATAHNIDWQAFSQATKNTPISSTQLMKLVHEKLPTSYELSKTNPHVSPKCRSCDSTETFTHLLLCQNPISQQFRHTVYSQLGQFLHANDIPEQFQVTFLQGIHSWLHQHDTTSRTTQPPPAFTTDQVNIGWHLIFRGFFSIQWRYQLDKLFQRYDIQPTRTPLQIISGLIRIIWNTQMKLWEEHLSFINAQTQSMSQKSKEKKNEYESRIRLLHEQKKECLHHHRDQYFFQDPETFLQTATLTQMKSYLHQYEPAIRHSILTASKTPPAKSLFTFPGFHRVARQHKGPSVHPLTNYQQGNRSNGSGETTFPYKHTRWKKVTSAYKSIREYFKPQNPT